MQTLQASLMQQSAVPHCCPSDREEVQRFMYLPEVCMQQLRSKDDDMESYEFFKFH